MTAHIFREYDIRGVAERDLGNDLVQCIGRELARMLAADERAPRLVVGRDCRSSGPRIHEHLVRGLTEGGAHVLDIGIGPTPKTYFAVHHLDADGGIMITGSHNPGDENGFKIMRGKAPFFGTDIQKLRARIESSRPGSEERGTVETIDVDTAYVERLLRDLDVPDTRFPVVIDAGNGAAGPLAVRCLEELGFSPVQLYCDMDGTFPNHHPDPTVVENLRVLIETVTAEKARVGLAFDGDGDRLGIVDASGRIVWGDRLLALFARDVLKHRPGAAVLGEVKCSQALFDDVERHGGRPIVYKTGHSLIKTKMKEEGALLAGEMSGHFFFADRYYGYDDAIYAALRVLEIVSREGRSVVELLGDLPEAHSTPEIRVDCPDALKKDVVAEIERRFSPKYRLVTIDGVRIQYEDGAWALVRASNTGPILVLRFEAPTEDRLAAIRNEVEGALSQIRREIENSSSDG